MKLSEAQKWFGDLLDLKTLLNTKLNTSHFTNETMLATNTLTYFQNLTSLLDEYMSDDTKKR